MKLFLFIQALIEGRTKNRFLSALLWICSLGWGGISKFRNFLYDRSIFSAKKAPAVVISVGNLVAGGTGKTPLVHLFARTFAARVPTAILTRGYRGGDEARLLARRLPLVPVYTGKRRIDSARQAAAEGAKLLLLDDGFQHRQLARDCDCLLLHTDDLWGHGYYLPRGYLRDSPERVAQADMIFLYPIHSEAQWEKLSGQFPRAIGLSIGTQRVVDAQGEEVSIEQGMKVGAFAGIAHPDRFSRTVESLGYEIILTIPLADHEAIGFDRLVEFARECLIKGAKALICTEKDWVKLPSQLVELPLPVWFVEIELTISAGYDRWLEWVEHTSSKLQRHC